MMQKICKVCGNEFVASRIDASFCSNKCQNYYNNHKEFDIKCENCGRIFKGIKGKQYCSKECEKQGYLNKMKRSCLNCGKTFNARNDKAKFCSRKCRYNYKTERECEICGTIFLGTQGQNYCSDECKQKGHISNMQKTSIEKYGETNCMKNEEYKEKLKNSCMDKYGVECYTQTDEYKEKARQTCLEKYGVPYHCMTAKCRNSATTVSGINKQFAKLLTDNGYEYEMEFPLGDYSYDFKIGNSLIELNPYPYHNVTRSPVGRKIDKKYHKEKTEFGRSQGYRVIQVFDWDNWDKILMLLDDKKETLYARKCEVRQVTYEEAHNLFDNYHLQGDTKKDKSNLYIGLIYEGKLVECISYGTPRYNKNYEWEILRLCTHKDYKVVGGASKIHKYFLELTNCNSCISYCDMGKFDGKVYEQLGFKLLKRNSPSRHWLFTGLSTDRIKELEERYKDKVISYDGDEFHISLPSEKHLHFTDNQINIARGFDQMLGQFFGCYGKGTRNDELLREFGYVEIYDAGQATFIWNKEN